MHSYLNNRVRLFPPAFVYVPLDWDHRDYIKLTLLTTLLLSTRKELCDISHPALLGWPALWAWSQLEGDGGTSPKEEYHSGVTGLKVIHHFTYPEYTMTCDARLENEVDDRLATSGDAFVKLNKYVWYNIHMKKVSEINTNRTVVNATLFYGSQLWVIITSYDPSDCSTISTSALSTTSGWVTSSPE